MIAFLASSAKNTIGAQTINGNHHQIGIGLMGRPVQAVSRATSVQVLDFRPGRVEHPRETGKLELALQFLLLFFPLRQQAAREREHAWGGSLHLYSRSEGARLLVGRQRRSRENAAKRLARPLSATFLRADRAMPTA